MPFETISTEAWRISLPADWKAAETTSHGGFYVQSHDETKGIYVTTWNISTLEGNSTEKVRLFLAADLRGLRAMEGKKWNILEELFYEQGGCVTAGFDACDLGSSYRILSKIMAKDEWLVRSSFHDYDCTDYARSRNLLAPIANSLEIHK